jgi:hypothetical protein
VAIRLALRRAPLTTMLGIGVLGLALHAGVIRLPAAIVAPVTRAHLALQGWERRQAGDLACQVAATSTLLGTGGSVADRVARGCGLAASAQPAGRMVRRASRVRMSVHAQIVPSAARIAPAR